MDRVSSARPAVTQHAGGVVEVGGLRVEFDLSRAVDVAAGEHFDEVPLGRGDGVGHEDEERTRFVERARVELFGGQAVDRVQQA